MYKAQKEVFAISNMIHFFQQMFIQQIRSTNVYGLGTVLGIAKQL